MAPIGVAIIGSGIFVREQHLPAVLANPSFSLKAIYSRSLKSAQALDSGVDLYSDDSEKSYKQLLARQDITAVIIALPIPTQPSYIKEALSAGKHVFAEKPIAKDIATAQELIAWYHSTIDTAKVTLGIAEQFRYLKAFLFARDEVARLGGVLGFRVRMHAFVQEGSKYYETAWRKKPEYQGGFLLDGGVHFIAGIRLMLGEKAKMERVSAYTTLLQQHLPPVDTVDATFRLANGRTGTFCASFGTTFSGAEWAVACEGGVVSVVGSKVTTKVKRGEETSEEFQDEGVKQEVDAWAESLVRGEQEAYQKPEEALADLEILECMLQSGEADGKPIDLKLQV